MWINASGFTGKGNNEIASYMYSFLLFLYNFEFLLGPFYFPRVVFDIMYEDFLYCFYSLPFWESPSGDFDITVFLIYIIHAY